MIKETHNQFVEEFKQKIEQNRAEFEKRGVDTNYGDDLGVFAESLRSYLDKKSDEVDLFASTFWSDNIFIIADICGGSPYIAKTRPFEFSLSYMGKTVGTLRFGAEIYKNVYGILEWMAKSYADNFIISINIVNGYLRGEELARSALIRSVDFQSVRNWSIVWAKTHWIKNVFPECYEKMIKDGEFLSLEEIEEKIKETNGNPA